MTQGKIKVTLSDGSSVLKNWEQSYEAGVPGLVEAVKQVKQSVNEYLTRLVDQGKSLTSKDKTELTVEDVDDEEEIKDDVISGLIKNMGTGSEKSKRSKKQKNNYSKFSKKQKK